MQNRLGTSVTVIRAYIMKAVVDHLSSSDEKLRELCFLFLKLQAVFEVMTNSHTN